jgi:hypothetical protein
MESHMRTPVKLAVMSLTAAALIGGSATAAAAHDKRDSDLHKEKINANHCGNPDQKAWAEPWSYVEQEAEGDFICQAGNGNKAFNYSPETHLVYIGGLEEPPLDGLVPLT